MSQVPWLIRFNSYNSRKGNKMFFKNYFNNIKISLLLDMGFFFFLFRIISFSLLIVNLHQAYRTVFDMLKRCRQGLHKVVIVYNVNYGCTRGVLGSHTSKWWIKTCVCDRCTVVVNGNTINYFQCLEDSVNIVNCYCLQCELIRSGGEPTKNTESRTKTSCYCLC